LCVNEIGMPTNNVKKANNKLLENFGSEFWKVDPERFGTNGSQEGLFLLPNYNIKDIWFPSTIKIKPEPFKAVIENNGKKYFMEYKNEEIKTFANN
jgi:hypothetical protein